MVNRDKIIRAFKENFDKMTYQEREAYLNKMGFSFGTKEENKNSNLSTERLFASEFRVQDSIIYDPSRSQNIMKRRKLARRAGTVKSCMKRVKRRG